MIVHRPWYQFLVEWWDFLGGSTVHVHVSFWGWALLALILAVVLVAAIVVATDGSKRKLK